VDTAAPGAISLANAGRAVDDGSGREIGARDVLHQRLEVERRVVDQRDAGVDHFAQVMRRDIGRHADRDATRSVDEQVRDARRQHRRLTLLAVVVRHEIDRFHVDVGEQFAGNAVEAALGITHRSRGIAIDGAEITLTVDQRVAQREILRHAHQRVVDRAVTVRVILTHHFTDDARAFHVRPVPDVVRFLHREQYAAVNGFEPVAGIGKRAPHDYAHRVIHVGLTHFVFDVDGQQLTREIDHRKQTNLLIQEGDFPSPGSAHLSMESARHARLEARALSPRTNARWRRDRDVRSPLSR